MKTKFISPYRVNREEWRGNLESVENSQMMWVKDGLTRGRDKYSSSCGILANLVPVVLLSASGVRCSSRSGWVQDINTGGTPTTPCCQCRAPMRT
jgi:hypothetical protein